MSTPQLPIEYLDTGKIARDKINNSFNAMVETVAGYRPHIENGYWWIGNTNTGVKAKGDNVEMKVENGYIWYKSSSVNEWTQIIAVEDLKGDKGDTGDAATLCVGTVCTGAPGSDVCVTNSGDEHAAVLNFTIPQGATGCTGATGASICAAAFSGDDIVFTKDNGCTVTLSNAKNDLKGDTGAAATVDVGCVTTGAAGTDVCVTNSGTTCAAVLNFTIPQGIKGDDGAAATVTAGTTTTGEPGTCACVTNSGTSSAAVLNFTIPKGSKGDTGATGPSIVSAAFSDNDIVFTKDDSCTVTLCDAKTTLKGDTGETGCTGATGNGIACTTCSKSGKVTTVTMHYTDGNSDSFSVQDGQDGQGAGDMLACVYDPNNVGADAFNYCNFTNTPDLSCKQDKLTAGANIDLVAAKVSATNTYIITEANTCTTYTGTKGVAPYNTCYCYTNICIDPTSGIEWKEGSIYTFDIDTEMLATSACRNVRVKIGDGDYIPVMGTSSILGGHSYFTKADIRQYQYSTKYQSGGALHLFTDSNTTYSAMSQTEIDGGTCTCGRTMTAANLKYAINTFAPIEDSLTSTCTTSALSANQGRILKGCIDDLMAQGKFLSLWNSCTGQPISFPLETPYAYHTGDYFMVENVSNTTNYKPNGSSYTGAASTTTEGGEVAKGDYYVYDSTSWLLATNHGKTVSFANLAGDPNDNTCLCSALAGKQDSLTLAGSPTCGHLVAWGANNKTFTDGGTIPTNVSAFNNDSGYTTCTGTVVASDLTPYAKSCTLCTVATSGKYCDLSGRVTDNCQIANGCGYTTCTGTLSTCSDVISALGYTPYNSSNPSGYTTCTGTLSATNTGCNGQVLTKTSSGATWCDVSGGDVLVSSQNCNILTSGMKIWAGCQCDYENLGTYDNNTVYLTIE